MINDVRQTVAETTLNVNGVRIRNLIGENSELCQVDYFRLQSPTADGWYICSAELRLTFVEGTGRLVLFDSRRNSTQFGAVMEILGGSRQPLSVEIPSGVAVAWQSLEDGCTWIMATVAGAELKQEFPIDTTLIPFMW